MWHHGAGADQRTPADLGPWSDDGAWVDGHAALDARRRMDEGVRRHAARLEQRGRSRRVRKKPPRNLDEGMIGVAHEQHADVVRYAACEAFDGQTSTGAGRRELIDVFGLVEEGEITGTGTIERRYAGDAPVELSGAMRLGRHEPGDLA